MGTPLSTTQWTSLGPAPVNNGAGSLLVCGRIEAVAPHPSITGRFFAAGQNGGIWQTNDSGTTWAPLTDGQPSLVFNGSHVLMIQPANTNVIVGGVAAPRGGILISQDGGTTWQHQPITNNDDPRGVAFDTSNQQTLYVANGWNGFYKSTNLGTSWSQANPAAGYFADVLMMPSGTLYTVLLGAADSSKNGVYSSVDGGAHWKHLTSTTLASGSALGNGCSARLAGGVRHYLTHVAHTEYVYVSFLTVDTSGNVTAAARFVTDDNGLQWSALAASPGNLESRQWHHTIAAAPESPNVVFVNDAYALYVSYDYGQTWTHAGPGWDWVNLTFGMDGNVYATADQGLLSINLQGLQAASMVGNLAVTQFYTVALDASNWSNLYGVAQDIGALKSTGSTSWSGIPGGEAGKLLVDFTNSNTIYVYNTTVSGAPGATGYDLVIRSTDQGQTWTTILDGSNAGSRCNAVLQSGGNLYTSTQRSFEMDPTNAKRLAVGTTQVFVTSDATVAHPVWSALGGVLSTDSSGTDRWVQSLAIAPSDSSVLYAATDDGHVFVWNGAGATSWTKTDASLYGVSGGSVNDMRVDPANAAHAYAVTGGRGNNVWELVGGTWQNRSGNFPTDIGIYCIYVDWTRFAPATLIVGTDRGVYASSDNGTTWTAFAQGFPNTQVSDFAALGHLIFHRRPPFVLQEQIELVAVTYGRGAWGILVPSGVVSGV